MTALIWSPFANASDAKATAKALLEEGLIGCANIGHGIDSVFLWQGSIEQAEEVGCLFKTDSRLLKKAIKRLEQLHPYETPAILGWKCEEAGAETRTWLGELVGNHDGSGNYQT